MIHNKSILIGLLVFAGRQTIIAQSTDLVKTEGITSAFHRQNIGKIYFSPLAGITNDRGDHEYVSTYTLTNKSNLYFTAYLGNSLTNYLHELAPAISGDTLTKSGNYQFTIYIDNKKIYESNLLPGAPNARVQDTATIINKPLINNTGSYGIWSESFWNRMMQHGGESALSEGEHLLKMEIRPYLQYHDFKLGELIAAGELTVLVTRKPTINIAAIKLTPIQPYTGFLQSNVQFDSTKIKLLKGNIEAGVFKKISSIIVIAKGGIALEEYFNGANRNSLHDTRSVGKSFSGTITGMAIADHHLESEKITLSHFYNLNLFQHPSAAKGQVTIKDLLTMNSAFDGSDEDELSPGNEENMYTTNNWVSFTLNLPVKQPGKKEWNYFTAGVIVLGDILHKSVPGGLEKYADRKLFKPLGIINYKWQYTPQQIPNTAGGIQLTSPDLAKYGQLYQNNGLWNGHQIIPKNWVTKTFTKQINIQSRKEEYYGYLFWNKTFSVGDRKHEAFYCAGNGGNYILVFRELQLVVVITATAYGQNYAHPQVNKMLTEYIIPAFENVK